VLPEFDDVYVRAEVVELDVDPVRVGVDVRQGVLGGHPVADELGRAANPIDSDLLPTQDRQDAEFPTPPTRGECTPPILAGGRIYVASSD